MHSRMVHSPIDFHFRDMYIMHIEKEIEWNAEKAELLWKERGVDMNEIASLLKEDKYFAIEDVPNQKLHPGQKMFVLAYNDYTFCVPFVKDEETVFIKTAFPSRFYHKIYGGNNA